MKKALESGQIPNEVLKAIICKICSYLEQIFNNLLKLDYYSKNFKRFIIIILHKQRRNQNYINPKNYWLILSKIIKVILITKINYIATKYNLLLKPYFKN